MKVTQEKLPASQIGLEIEITPEITKQTYEQVIKNLASTANISGFRKGKVPRPILLQRLGTTRPGLYCYNGWVQLVSRQRRWKN